MKHLFLDKSGDHSLTRIDPQYPVFVLGGVVVDAGYAEVELTRRLERFKLDVLGGVRRDPARRGRRAHAGGVRGAQGRRASAPLLRRSQRRHARAGLQGRRLRHEEAFRGGVRGPRLPSRIPKGQRPRDRGAVGPCGCGTTGSSSVDLDAERAWGRVVRGAAPTTSSGHSAQLGIAQLLQGADLLGAAVEALDADRRQPRLHVLFRHHSGAERLVPGSPCSSPAAVLGLMPTSAQLLQGVQAADDRHVGCAPAGDLPAHDTNPPCVPTGRGASDRRSSRGPPSTSRHTTLQSAGADTCNLPEMNDRLCPRLGEAPLLEAPADSPAVLVHGPRPCGKTTLARMVGEARGYACFTFVDEVARAAAETFAYQALRRLASWRDELVRFSHYRRLCRQAGSRFQDAALAVSRPRATAARQRHPSAPANVHRSGARIAAGGRSRTSISTAGKTAPSTSRWAPPTTAFSPTRLSSTAGSKASSTRCAKRTPT